MGRRITRKQLKQDEFVSSVDTVMHWLGGNWRPVAAALGVVALVSLAWWGGTRWSSSRADRASFMLYEAVAAYEQQMLAPAPAAAPLDAEPKLEQVIGRYGRSDQADLARVYLARIRIARGESEPARALLVEVADRHPTDAVGRVATLDLLHLRMASGEGGEVAAELEAMAAGRDRRLPNDVALYELGELYVAQLELDRARQYLEKLVTDFPESPFLNPARQRLAELG